jgi:hypothetical protein
MKRNVAFLGPLLHVGAAGIEEEEEEEEEEEKRGGVVTRTTDLTLCKIYDRTNHPNTTLNRSNVVR